jgi:hypothetical protein
VSEHTPAIDFENLPTPSEGFLVTHFITVRSVARSRAFYSDVLGGQVSRPGHRAARGQTRQEAARRPAGLTPRDGAA